MRTKLIAGNWKMNLTTKEAAAVVEAFLRMVDAKTDVDVVICPPYVSLPRVRELVRNTHLKVGAQDVFWEPSGAFTGKVSAPMLVDVGVSFCIVGHSETRGRFGQPCVPPIALPYFCESDATINLKIKALLYHAINPILCVGETAEERENGQTDAVIASQLAAGLEGIDATELYFSVIAYEPVWAIGTGNTCQPEEAERVCASIRSYLAEMYDEDLAGEIRILYGGSVRSSNSDELFRQPNIDGALVGGASLDPHEFSMIVMSA